MEFHSQLPSNSPALENYGTPELMAIGDSIYNGVRSLSITPTLARLSAPALVARGLNINGFRIPEYPRPILFDLEDHVREGIDFDRLLDEILDNAKAWIDDGGVWTQTKCFDNIAIAGATYKDLHDNTSKNLKERAKRAFAYLCRSRQLDYCTILDLYYSINGAFLLNPSGDPDLDNLTPLQQVFFREPKRLLVNIGSNDGLFEAALTASWPGQADQYKPEICKIPSHVETLADVLKRRCAKVEHIYFNLLVQPRFLANLAPRNSKDLWNPPKSAQYFPEYVGRLGYKGKLKAAEMKEFDETVESVNEKTKKILRKRLGRKVKIVDLYSWSKKYDRKHGTEKQAIWVISNYPLSVRPGPFSLLGMGAFGQGGFFSLDNMHPTTVGYAFLANHLLCNFSNGWTNEVVS